jgi:hypothetical protein
VKIAIQNVSLRPPVLPSVLQVILSTVAQGGIVTGYDLDGRRSNPGREKVSFLRKVQTGSGAHAASYQSGQKYVKLKIMSIVEYMLHKTSGIQIKTTFSWMKEILDFSF